MVESDIGLEILAKAAAGARSSLCVAQARGRDMVLVYVNAGFTRTTGYAAGEVLGRDPRFLQGPDTDPAEVARIRDGVRHGRSFTSRLLNYRKDGQPFWCEMHLTPITDDATGELTHYVGIQHDITGWMEQQRLLARRNLQLREQARRLADANEDLHAYSSAVSHDLRGPLGVLRSLMQGIAPALAGGQVHKALEIARVAEASADRMAQLVEALLVACSIGHAPLRRMPVDIGELARECLAELQASEPARQVQAQVAPGLWASGDPALLRSLVANLVSNAWKYSRRAPVARIEVGRRPDAGSEAVFYVRDNGTGFDAAGTVDFFQPFRRLHHGSEFPGIGLGLATARRICERHGGWIRAESRPGEGACFLFCIPSHD